MTAPVVALRAERWLGYLSNADLIARFSAAVEAEASDGVLDVLHEEILARQVVGTLGDEDWFR
jgi:hypothetical protein